VSELRGMVEVDQLFQLAVVSAVSNGVVAAIWIYGTRLYAKFSGDPVEPLFRMFLTFQTSINTISLYLCLTVWFGIFPNSFLFHFFLFLLGIGIVCMAFCALKPSQIDLLFFAMGCAPWIYMVLLTMLNFVYFHWPTPFG
jgi:hypothetical protein